jgi:hypothetical protein
MSAEEGENTNRTAGIRRSERRRYGKYWRNFLLRKCIFVKIRVYGGE